MTERPILFSAPMVRALLARTKTQTRRVVKPQFAADALPVEMPAFDPIGGWVVSGHSGIWWCEAAANPDDTRRCPYGQPGDRLWVKETTLKVEDHGWVGPVYAESDTGRIAQEWGYGEWDDPDHIEPWAIKRRPAVFMSRAMSRITLEVVRTRVERLWAISEADALAEGIGRYDNGTFGLDDPAACMGPTAVIAYMRLWNHINGQGSWDANPWVWAVEFRRVA